MRKENELTRTIKLNPNEELWCIETYHHAYQQPSQYGKVCIPVVKKFLLNTEEGYQDYKEEWLVANADGFYLVIIDEYDSNQNQSQVSFAPTQWRDVSILKVDLKDIDYSIDRIVNEIEYEDEYDDE